MLRGFFSARRVFFLSTPRQRIMDLYGASCSTVSKDPPVCARGTQVQQLHNDVSAASPWSNEPVPGPDQPWRRRIAAGALLTFILLLVSLPGSVAAMIVGPGSISLVMCLALFIPVSAARVIAMWLMTTPLPQEAG